MAANTMTKDGGDGSSLPKAKACTCDECVSAHRTHPTAVSDTKCVPAMELPMGLTCDPKGKFPQRTLGKFIPYQMYCTCACQPFLKRDSKFQIGGEPASCVDMDAKEKKLVDKQGPHCEDPKLPTQMEQEESMKMSADDMMKLAKTANTPAPKPATKKIVDQVKKVWAARDEAKKQAEAATLAA